MHICLKLPVILITGSLTTGKLSSKSDKIRYYFFSRQNFGKNFSPRTADRLTAYLFEIKCNSKNRFFRYRNSTAKNRQNWLLLRFQMEFQKKLFTTDSTSIPQISSKKPFPSRLRGRQLIVEKNKKKQMLKLKRNHASLASTDLLGCAGGLNRERASYGTS